MIRRGQSLLEVVLVVGIATIIVFGLVRVVTTSVSKSTYSRQQAQSTRLASEAMEWIREERDKGWNNFYGHFTQPGFCLEKNPLAWGENPSDGSAAPCANQVIGTEFYRWAMITVIPDAVDPTKISVNVDVKVRWSDSKETHTTQMSGTFTNWRTR